MRFQKRFWPLTGKQGFCNRGGLEIKKPQPGKGLRLDKGRAAYLP
jgi:hypothetical protein